MLKLSVKQDLSGFYKQLTGSLKNRHDILIEHYPLIHKCGTYDFLKIKSKSINDTDRLVLIRANLHGDEVAGAYTMLYHLNKIFDYAHKKNIKLIVYPLANPSGFEYGTRFNADGDKGDLVNNDFLRYELPNGKLVKDIHEGRHFVNFYWSSDPRAKVRLPAETKLMHRLLRADPLGRIMGDIDLHQDYISREQTPAAYHYSFGELTLYRSIVQKMSAIIPIWRNRKIGAGFKDAMQSDKQGFIIRHDGSMSNLLYRMGTRFSVDCETTGGTPLDLACQVNLIWILGIIDLVAKKT